MRSGLQKEICGLPFPLIDNESNKRNSAEKKQRRGSRRGKSKATWLRSAGCREKKVSTNKCPCVTHCREVRVFNKREKTTEDCP